LIVNIEYANDIMKNSKGIGICAIIIILVGIFFIYGKFEIGFVTGQVMVTYGLILLALSIIIFILGKIKEKKENLK